MRALETMSHTICYFEAMRRLLLDAVRTFAGVAHGRVTIAGSRYLHEIDMPVCLRCR